MAESTVFQPGEPAPWLVARRTSNQRHHFDAVGGRYVVMRFLGSAREAYARSLVAGFEAHRGHFDDLRACFFGIWHIGGAIGSKNRDNRQQATTDT